MALALQLPSGRQISFDKPVVMGVLNVTPDSFSDGGRYADPDTAVAYALQMLIEGADLIDVGGESTRPGARRVDDRDQIGRVVPVIERLGRVAPEAVVSVDTTRAGVACAALDAGASIINDVSAGRDDEGMFALAAERGAPLILTHMRGDPQTMQDDPRYEDVVGEVGAYLDERAGLAVAKGVPRDQVLIDPGIGFGKTTRHNLLLLAHLDRFVSMGMPVVLGTSRKRFLKELCSPSDGHAPRPEDLAVATCATTALGVGAGVQVFRVHDVRQNRRAADVAWAIKHAGHSRG
jgi:dihydropteroate synthase